MCHGRSIGLQQGTPMTQETFAAMAAEERAFWHDFLGGAKALVEELRERGEEPPFTPTESIRRKYDEAIAKYDGGHYCQMSQVKELFGL